MDPVSNDEITFAKIALRDRDAELLELLLSLNSDVFKS